jgi:hypothetical protein
MNDTVKRPASQPDLHTLLLGGSYLVDGKPYAYIGYTNLIPLNDENVDVSKMLKNEQDREHFASLIHRIVETENGRMEQDNLERFSDSQFVPYTRDEVDAAMDALHATYKKNVEAYWEHLPDLKVKHIQENNAPVSRGALIRSRSVQVALADDKPSGQSA